MEEEWRDVVGYEGLYQVSNFGRVKSLPRNGTVNMVRILRPNIKKTGYINYALQKNNALKTFLAHRLVAQAFMPNPDNLPQVNHIDGDKTNNRVDNLEWCTQLENIRHRSEVLDVHGGSPRKKVYCAELNRNFNSISEAAKFCGICSSGIRDVCNGIGSKGEKRVTAGGYHWEWAHEAAGALANGSEIY